MARPASKDPLDKFRFRVYASASDEEGASDVVLLAGFMECSGPKRRTNEITWRNGDDPAQLKRKPGISQWDEITLKAGDTVDNTMYDWIQHTHKEGEKASENNYRKTIFIERIDKDGVADYRWICKEAWAKDFEAADLSSTDDGEISMLSLIIVAESIKPEIANSDGEFI